MFLAIDPRFSGWGHVDLLRDQNIGIGILAANYTVFLGEFSSTQYRIGLRFDFNWEQKFPPKKPYKQCKAKN